MKKFYRIIAILITFIFLTTYSPNNLNVFPEKENTFFKIQNIKILNNDRISESEIEKKLKHIFGKNILTIKKDDIAIPLKSIDFLGKIEVKKKYPNILVIKVYETKPMAILFKKNKKYFLDNLSNLILLDKGFNTDDFPNIFGEEAENHFMNFFNKLNDNNFPKHRVKNYYYFQIGRWDLQLLNEQVIKFPPEKMTEAIQQSIKLLNRKDFENYNIIDLRIEGKIVVE